MITKLEINNFRNLAHLSLDFTKKTSIISGKNELGKSNSLNALMWALTGMLFTDKWGSGENDIESIIPRNATRGLDPEVSITFDTGSKFTKVFVTTYTREGKVNGHKTTYLVNGVAQKNIADFNNLFYEALGFKPSLNVADIKEVNLFVDPLYALQKLDAKTLRRLLVELGCSVTNEEMYKLGFEDLRPYEAKYFGKWDVMRKALKDEAKGYEKRLEDINLLLATKTDCEFDQAELDSLNALKNSIIAELERIKTDNTNRDVVELENQIKVLKAQLDGNAKAFEVELNNFKKNQELELQNLRTKLQMKYDDDCKALKEKYIESKHKQDLLRAKVQNLKSQKGSEDLVIDNKLRLQRMNADNKSKYSIELAELQEKKYQMARCPICGTEFAPDEDDFQKFEKERLQKLHILESNIEACIINDENYSAELKTLQKKLDDISKAIVESEQELANTNEEIETLQNQLENISYDVELQNKIKEVESRQKPVYAADHQLQAQIYGLETELKVLKEKDDTELIKKIMETQQEITGLDEKIGALYIKRSKAAEKEELLTEQKELIKKLNDTESLLGRLNQFIATMIRLINQKATEKTGMTFVMLEENLTNDGLTEVCYPTIDGVPFKDINTAKKMQYGIKFIDTLKSILGTNNLPILADRMEGIDDISKIDQLTQSQLICTRVSNSEKMEVL